MKTILLIVPAFLFALGSSAQKPGNDNVKQEILTPDSVIMKEGSVLYSKNGERTVILTEIIIGGTRVQADGAVIFSDGTTEILKEGDVILSDGTLVRRTIKAEREVPEKKQP